MIQRPGGLFHPITYGAAVNPLAAPTVSGISQTSAMVSIVGTLTPGTIYVAARTSGPYASTDQALVKNGTGAVWHDNNTNALARHFLAEGLTANTTYYLGSYIDTGSETPVEGASFTTLDELPESTTGKVPVLGE